MLNNKGEIYMKSKKLLSLFISVLTLTSLAGCGGNSNTSSSNNKPNTNNSGYDNATKLPDDPSIANNGTITVWVGAESVEYYDKVLHNYRIRNKFPYTFNVVKSDAGDAAKVFLEDPEKGADIFTVAHDNLAKLTDGQSAILPITDPNLQKQIEDDNSETFVDVISQTRELTSGTKTFMFAVPYVTQSLFLYYNTAVVSEEQAQTWEGLRDAAKAAGSNVKACTFLGKDNFNFSWSILARQMPGNTSTLKLYDDKKAENCYFQGDDMIAVTKWVQSYFKDANGATFPSSSGWEVEITPEKGKNVGSAVAVVGGAWSYEKAKGALGENLGVAKLPTFTTTEKVGSIEAGTTFQSGSFYDCKAFVMKKSSKYAQYLQEIVGYLASKSVQEGSFVECNNLPAYKNAANEFAALKADTFEAKVANIQYEMEKYSIPQPFGTGELFNQYYYDCGGADLYEALILDKDGSLSSYEGIKSELANIENVWKTGKKIV